MKDVNLAIVAGTVSETELVGKENFSVIMKLSSGSSSIRLRVRTKEGTKLYTNHAKLVGHRLMTTWAQLISWVANKESGDVTYDLVASEDQIERIPEGPDTNQAVLVGTVVRAASGWDGRLIQLRTVINKRELLVRVWTRSDGPSPQAGDRMHVEGRVSLRGSKLYVAAEKAVILFKGEENGS